MEAAFAEGVRSELWVKMLLFFSRRFNQWGPKYDRNKSLRKNEMGYFHCLVDTVLVHFSLKTVGTSISIEARQMQCS